METKEYYEINLPGYLQHDLDAMKEGKWPYDCLWGELYGSINCAFIDGDITEDHAWYLRENIWIWKESDLLTRWIPSGRRVT